jgi:hypothetical protein
LILPLEKRGEREEEFGLQTARGVLESFLRALTAPSLLEHAPGRFDISAATEGALMEPVQDDRFVVFVRESAGHHASPETVEREVSACSSYDEARRVQQTYRQTAQECVIRYVGQSGGGD